MKIPSSIRKRKEWSVLWNVLRTMLAGTAICMVTGLPLNNPTAFVTALAFLILFSKESKWKEDKKQKLFANITGGVYAVMAMLGSYSTWMAFDFVVKGNRIINVMVVASGLFFLSVSSVKAILHFLEKRNPVQGDSKKNDGRLWGLLCYGLILGFWMIYFIAFYPALRTDDSVNQMQQVLGEIPYSNHHPLIHTLFLKIIFDTVFTLFGKQNVAIAATTLVQMLILAGIYTYMLIVIRKAGTHKYYNLSVLVYVALFPVNAFFAVTMWKDVLFGGFVLLFLIYIWQISRMRKDSFGGAKEILLWTAFFFCGVLLSLWRSNGFYAYIFCVPFFLISSAFRKRKIPLAAICVLTVVSVSLIKGPVMDRLQVIQPDFVEHISIPIQQVSRVIVDRGERLSEEERSLISEVINPEQVSTTYLSYISDPMKNMIRMGNAEYLTTHKAEFFQLWIRLGVKYPDVYLKAAIDATNGYWNPNVKYWVTANEITTLPVYEDSLVPGLVGILNEINIVAANIPLLSVWWKIGFYVWAEMFCLFYCLKTKKNIAVFMPLVAIFLTLIAATPVAAEFRYGYPFVTALPFLLAVTFPQSGLCRSKVEAAE